MITTNESIASEEQKPNEIKESAHRKSDAVATEKPLSASDLGSAKPEMLEVRLQWQGATIDIGHYQAPRLITAGPHSLNDFRVGCDAFGDASYPLIVPLPGEQFGVFVTSSFGGSVVDQQGESQTLAAWMERFPATRIQGFEGRALPISAGERYCLQLEDLTVEISLVQAEPQEEIARRQHWDYLLWRITSFSAIAHLALILMFQFVPSGKETLQNKRLTDRFSGLIVVPQEAPKQKEKFQLKEPRKRPVVRPEITKNTHQKTNEPQETKTSTPARLKKKGVLGLLMNQMGSAGTGNVFGKIRQDWLPPGKMLGVASNNASSFGLGVGRCLGTNCGGGDGDGGGSQYGGGGQWGQPQKRKYRRGAITSTGRRSKKSTIKIQPGLLTFAGGLGKEEIGRVVRSNWFMIQHCYESQLRRNPGLAGKIKLKWIIAGSGKVQTVAVIQSTMNNERVENCLVRRILKWNFPAPRGGGMVFVKYPFLFFHAGK